MNYELHQGEALEVLRGADDAQFRCCITSPPYWGLRDYGVAGQLGLEKTPEAYIERLVEIFEEVRRVLTDDGTLWLNLGDSYAGGGCGARDPERWPKQQRNLGSTRIHIKRGSGLKNKNLVGIPWMAAFALRSAGWYLRQDIIWAKPNPMPGAVIDRCVSSHEYLFLLSKSATYSFDYKAIREPFADDRKGKSGGTKTRERNVGGRTDGFTTPGNIDPSANEGRNKRSVWNVAVAHYHGAHFAVMPEKLVEPCVLAGSAPGDLVLDPFAGSGTVGAVALRHGRKFVGIDLNPEYLALASERISGKEKAA